ncbi:MAG: cyclic nucleotide-binding domain-containing protein [Armatimonadota bacterium]|nr:cyclic nucleotide-binding domain-containing protein [Armatimonadota bacterium]MDR7444155.1 cyclic nucleotide-binding domain-containing protein [Armatimonadota bacterium]MDR7571034.1 cyclic nucleotide-binding domain-containing protein [Armatimonadota bacterium]MDR7613604.1 cyclic nucleotide-binding domain-containing protein [Armatimonadota bacterium]
MRRKARVCLTCQRLLVPAGAKFCPYCGTARTLAGTSASSHSVVTVVLADRNTGKAAGEPEDGRGLLGQFYDLARRVVERCGVPVSNLLGEGMLAVFGLQNAHQQEPHEAGPVKAAPPGTAGEPELARLPLFAGYTAAELAPLAGAVRRRLYHRGEVIFREGDPATGVYLVERGRVRVGFTSTDGRERTLALLGPGEVVGEVPVLDGGVRSADGVAQDDCVVLFVAREDLVGWLRQRPEVALRLIHLLGQRLQAADLQVRDAAFLDVRGRLVRILLRLGVEQGERQDDGTVLCPRLSQTELAHLIGATRESVNRWLGRFERMGMVRRAGDRWILADRLRRELY